MLRGVIMAVLVGVTKTGYAKTKVRQDLFKNIAHSPAIKWKFKVSEHQF